MSLKQNRCLCSQCIPDPDLPLGALVKVKYNGGNLGIIINIRFSYLCECYEFLVFAPGVSFSMNQCQLYHYNELELIT